MTLREIWDKHSCDKGRRHGYECIYQPLLEHRREEPITLLEVGVFRGASVAAWLEYLPNASIIVVDTFERIPKKDIKILDHPHVTAVVGDSKTVDLSDFGPVDFAVDDGDHRPRSQAATFRNLFPLLREGGTYVIEDVFPWDEKTAALPWIKARAKDFNDKAWDELGCAVGGLRCVPFDLRKGRQPDSCAVVVHNP